MSITQTVDIPASHKLTIDVPSEVPEGKATITFTPAPKRKLTEAEEIEYIKANAEWLNRQAEDTLEFQSLDAFEEDLERLAPEELAAMRGAVVPFSLADIVSDRDGERPNRASKESPSP